MVERTGVGSCSVRVLRALVGLVESEYFLELVFEGDDPAGGFQSVASSMISSPVRGAQPVAGVASVLAGGAVWRGRFPPHPGGAGSPVQRR